jgi:hypothetical protein
MRYKVRLKGGGWRIYLSDNIPDVKTAVEKIGRELDSFFAIEIIRARGPAHEDLRTHKPEQSAA